MKVHAGRTGRCGHAVMRLGRAGADQPHGDALQCEIVFRQIDDDALVIGVFRNQFDNLTATVEQP